MMRRERVEEILANAYEMAEKCRHDRALQKVYGSYFEQLIGRYEIYLKEVDAAGRMFEDQEKIKDAFVRRVYEDCIVNMKDTREDWQRVADFFKKQSQKHPEKTAELLKCYDMLDEAMKERRRTKPKKDSSI